MSVTSEEIIARLKAARNRPPSLDKGAVEAAFEEHFRQLGLKPLPVCWVPDPMRGFLTQACRAAEGVAQSWVYNKALNAAERAIRFMAPPSERMTFYGYSPKSRRRLPELRLPKNETYYCAEAAAWRNEESIVYQATYEKAKRRTYTDPKYAHLCSAHWNVARRQAERAAKRAALAAAWLSVAPSPSERFTAEAWKMYDLWQPFVDAFEAGLWLYWVMKEEILAVSRPISHIREGRQYHCETERALYWPGGVCFWFYKSVLVNEQIILRPHTLTVEQILKESNKKVQWVMIERFGLSRWIREAGARVKLDMLNIPHNQPEWLKEVPVEVTHPSTGRRALLWLPWKPKVHRDNQRLLHCETGPALRWPDGSGLYFWHGVRVPKQVIMHPETLTPEQILKEPNVEVRRVMIERFGADRLLRESAEAQKLDDSLWGTLYQLPLPGDEPLVMVKVTCPSTGRVYFLRVPPYVRSAREAIAWTFGISSRAYKPIHET